ncbi:MAG: response regulator transcription factor [Bacteroidetes bacterium]|nr:response regulator transcription factor [Bacteroidota bacterium]
MLQYMRITIGIADDQQLFLQSLTLLINTFPSFEVVASALNGDLLLQRLSTMEDPPDILLLDVQMPVMDGITAAREVAARYPAIKIVALSTKDDDTTIIRMFRTGCCSYLVKDIHASELERALLEISKLGYYNADVFNINHRRLLQHTQKEEELNINDRELAFLRLACSDKTYRQIASEMHLSERTIDGYRESLFEKLNVQSRVGMALEAIRRQLVSI